MPQLDFLTILNQFSILLIIIIPSLFLFKILIYPTLDLLLRIRIYRYNIILKANKFKLLILLNMLLIINNKLINIKYVINYLTQSYYQSANKLDDFLKLY
jgi:hypothetical protein